MSIVEVSSSRPTRRGGSDKRSPVPSQIRQERFVFRPMIDILSKLRNFEKQLTQKLRREPSMDELAAFAEIRSKKYVA